MENFRHIGREYYRHDIQDDNHSDDESSSNTSSQAGSYDQRMDPDDNHKRKRLNQKVAERQRKRRNGFRRAMFCRSTPMKASPGDSQQQFLHDPSDPLSSLCQKLRSRKFKNWRKVLDVDTLRVHAQSIYVSPLFKPLLPSKTCPLRVLPSDELSRHHIVVMYNKETDEWDHLYEIKPSLIPGAGLGLYAARAFSKGDCMGVYYGKVLDESGSQHGFSEYAMLVSRPFFNKIETYVVEQCVQQPRRTQIPGLLWSSLLQRPQVLCGKT